MDMAGKQYRAHKKIILTYAFLLPQILFFLILALNRLWPFADVGTLDGDLLGQYLDYYCYMKDVYAGKRDLFYSFSKTLGGDMTGIWAYYLLSPLNLIYLLIPYNALHYAAVAVISIKLGLCGFTAALFLSRKSYGNAAVLIFSTAYALMTWNMLYFNNIMWLDGVYMLPLLIFTLERIIEGKGALAYTLALAYSLIVNYYIAWMLCLFILIYYLCRWMENKSGLRCFLRFALYSLLAASISAVVLLPTALALSGTKAGVNGDVFSLAPMFTVRQLLEKFVCRAVPSGQVMDDQILTLTPPFYCGAISTGFTLLYFFNGGIARRRRIMTAVIYLVLTFSHYLKGPYLVWHAFNYPSSFPYRFTFVFSFMMILTAAECWEQRKSLNLRSFIAAAALLLSALIVLEPIGNHLISRRLLLMDIVFMAASAFLLRLSGQKNVRAAIVGALLLMQMISLVLNAGGFVTAGKSMGDHAAEYDEKSALIDSVLSADDGFYRMALRNEKLNDPMRFSYDGLSHFCSTEKQQTKRFALNFGLRHFLDVWVSNSHGATAGADAFFNVKYIISHEPVRDYPPIQQLGSYDVYYNPNALPLAFPASPEVLGGDISEKDIFLWQECVWSATLGREAGIYTRQSVAEPELINLSTADFRDGAINYSPIDPEQGTFLIYRFTADSNRPVYMYTAEPFVEGEVSAELIVNGESLGRYMGSYNWRAFYLGCFEPGQEVEVCLRPEAGFFLQYETFFYYEDENALKNCASELIKAAEGSNLEKLSDSHLFWRGTVPEDKVLMMTVPADKGWHLTVDGQKAEILKAYDTLIALRLPSGEHEAELRFTPPGLYLGLAISAAAQIILVIIWLKQRKSR